MHGKENELLFRELTNRVGLGKKGNHGDTEGTELHGEEGHGAEGGGYNNPTARIAIETQGAQRGTRSPCDLCVSFAPLAVLSSGLLSSRLPFSSVLLRALRVSVVTLFPVKPFMVNTTTHW